MGEFVDTVNKFIEDNILLDGVWQMLLGVLIVVVVVAAILAIRYFIVKERCEMVGQPLTRRTFLRMPELYEMVTTPYRGTSSERRLVSRLLSVGFKPTAIYHDLMIESDYGKTTQIDIVVATDVGLIVIEVKDYIGWIFGKGNNDNWTQVSGYGKHKHRFYNPFKQNEGHIKALRGLSPQFASLPMYSLVVFAGDCELKNVSFIPHDSFLSTFYRATDAVRDIISSHPSAHYTDRWEVANLLKAAVKLGGNAYIQKQHVYDIHDMLGTNRRYE